MLASYPHSRVTSSTAAIYGGNRRRGGAIAHRDGGIGHRDGRIGRTSGYPGPFTAQVNPTGGSPGGPPTLPPTRASAAPRRSPRATPDMKKAPPQECLFKNAEPPPVDRTEGGRCAPGGTRTPNLLNRNQMLYPLSYGRFAVWLSISLHASHRDAKSNDVA